MVIRSLRAFLAVHRRGTIAAAAEEVHLSPAAISVQLKLMEERLGVELFVRTKRSLRLTPAGHRLIPLAEKMISIYGEMRNLAEPGAVHGKLSLGVWALADVFPGVIHKLKVENAGLEVKISAGISSVLMAQVDAGVLDAAVITRPSKELAANLLVHDLFTEPMALVLPSSMTYTDLESTMASAPYIGLDRTTWLGQQIDEYLARRGVQARPTMEFDALDAVVAVVGQGLGVSILPVMPGGAYRRDPALRFVTLPGFHRMVSLVERQVHPHAQLTGTLLSAFDAMPWHAAAGAEPVVAALDLHAA
jgi:DNA-binding transcriptional LysR family regulator